MMMKLLLLLLICFHVANSNTNTERSPVIVNTYENCASPSQDLELRIRQVELDLLSMRGGAEYAQNVNYTRDCSDVYNNGNRNDGVYTIFPEGSPKPFQVYCIFDSEGKWTVIQQRSDDTVDFYRNWAEYRNGFGIFNNNQWLGNEKIHLITRQRQYRLRIDLEDINQLKNYAEYMCFELSGEDKYYSIHYSTYEGNAGNALGSYHQGMNFSTFDRDNDASSRDNCAEKHLGGWWYNNCDNCNLNGPYNENPALSGTPADRGIEWDPLRPRYSFTKTMMRIRPNFPN